MNLNPLQLRVMELSSQVDRLKQQNQQLAYALSSRELFDQLLRAAIQGVSATGLSPEDIALKSYSIVEATLNHLKSLQKAVDSPSQQALQAPDDDKQDQGTAGTGTGTQEG